MRRIERAPLPVRAQKYLDDRQTRANADWAAGTLDIESRWSDARKTKTIGGAGNSVLSTLQQMSGPRHRCMYCLDSDGSDIEHFRPKAQYPQHAFCWPNLLLCCTPCGRFKLDKFPLVDHVPLLIDPTQDDPWQHLDFDPETGNLTARYEPDRNDYSAKGVKTVEVLQFDRRECLSRGYRRTFQRLSRIVREALQKSSPIATDALQQELREADDHGLLPWCFGRIGQTIEPFSALREHHPDAWTVCAHAVA
ncbi:MAG: hypothetical protein AB9M53_04830 [Leptothrix sp. (in: b-proteobacteria)]